MRKVLWSIAFLGFVSCQSAEIERLDAPENLIPKEKMVKIMTEMVKLETLIQSKYPQPAVYYPTMVRSGDSLLKTFGTNQKQYDESLSYYGSRMNELKEMYQETLENLNKELGEIQSK